MLFSSVAIEQLVMELARNAVFAPCSALAVPPCLFLKPVIVGFRGGRRELVAAASLEKDGFGRGVGPTGRKKIGTANSNYVVPLDMPTPGLVRPLAEILRDLNSRVSEKIINPENNSIPWYHANRMLSFYAPGWCGEVRDVMFSDDGSVTVVYRVTIRGSDGEHTSRGNEMLEALACFLRWHNIFSEAITQFLRPQYTS